MKEVVIISGKGGTGKTSITASFAIICGNEAIIADCDVDAADMHLLLEPDYEKSESFYSGKIGVIKQSDCLQCGLCAQICRFDALQIVDGKHQVTELDCEGCGYCARVCPSQAMQMIEQSVGHCFVSNIKTKTKMVHAKLKIGAENSGKLVAKVKKEAKALCEEENKNYIIIDGSPGIGCPVVSSLSGADYVVFVTEPSVSGIHDLKRAYELVNKFGIKSACIINKADINEEKTAEIKKFLELNNIDFIGQLLYNEDFSKAMTQGKTIIEYSSSNTSKLLGEYWRLIKYNLNKDKK